MLDIKLAILRIAPIAFLVAHHMVAMESNILIVRSIVGLTIVLNEIVVDIYILAFIKTEGCKRVVMQMTLEHDELVGFECRDANRPAAIDF